MIDKNTVFKDLFVLEMANNHWGSLDRGIKIIQDFGQVVKLNNVRAAIKLQFRDVDTFVHKEYKSNKDVRYIWKTMSTKAGKDFFRQLVQKIKEVNCVPMATPFDEISVDFCEELDLPIIKIASSDINDWCLVRKISELKKPVIVSTGGAFDKNIDDVVRFFDNRDIPIAINHCVSKYPSEDWELELNQIDYLVNKFPNHVIGLSTHEYHDWYSSMMISYTKGVRTWERHIDINDGKFAVSNYCSTPDQIDVWFKAYYKVKEMCGGKSTERRVIDEKEKDYLQSLYRGFYFKQDTKKGKKIKLDDLYLAIPFQKEIGHLSPRDFLEGSILNKNVKADEPLTTSCI